MSLACLLTNLYSIMKSERNMAKLGLYASMVSVIASVPFILF